MGGFVKGRYRHYKGKLYIVHGAGRFGVPSDNSVLFAKARHSETLSDIEIYYDNIQDIFIIKGDDAGLKQFLELEHVIYQACYDSEEFGNKAYWIRPREMFFEDVRIDGGRIPRFELIEDGIEA